MRDNGYCHYVGMQRCTLNALTLHMACNKQGCVCFLHLPFLTNQHEPQRADRHVWHLPSGGLTVGGLKPENLIKF